MEYYRDRDSANDMNAYKNYMMDQQDKTGDTTPLQKDDSNMKAIGDE